MDENIKQEEETRAYFPILTKKDGDRITKTCVEDVYKIMNRVSEILDRHRDKIEDIFESYNIEIEDVKGRSVEGYLIIGEGTSQPCGGDVFDEEIGNKIAFVKAKLNANIKKYNLVNKVINETCRGLPELYSELGRIVDSIKGDLTTIRKYNSDYLSSLEEDLEFDVIEILV